MKIILSIFFTLILLHTITSQNPLFIPDAITESKIKLSLQSGETVFFEGETTYSIGYNQNILGPTLILEKGKDVTIDVTNNISESTTLHWHGLHVSSSNDGGPHTIINPGETWSPNFTALDKAATYWYHPHLHEQTEKQVTLGASGFIIVRDQEEAALDLPRNYGIDDIPIVIQSRAFNEENQFLTETAADNTILCNATLQPYLEAPAQIVRLRLLNGSTERIFNLGLSNNQTFYQIATDGGLLANPLPLTRLVLAPGERSEVLLDLTDMLGDNLILYSYNSELSNGYYGAVNPSGMPVGSINGYSSNTLNGNDFEILQIDVVAQTNDAINTIPNTLVNLDIYSESDVDITRDLTFRSSQMGPTAMLNGPFNINNESFDLDVINQEVNLGSTEIWELTNMTAIAHPFHIHDVQFYILDINGVSPPQTLQGRKDVVLVPPMGGSVRFITQFNDFHDTTIPFMFHCHMLSHEDDGMMGQFLVLDNTTTNTYFQENKYSIFPNPSQNHIIIKGIQEANIFIYDNIGRIVQIENITAKNQQINISHLAPGNFIIRVIENKITSQYIFTKI